MIKKSNLFQWRRVQILSATFFCITFALISCKKETMIGKSALDPVDLLNSAAVDTFQLKTYTIAEDSVPTKNALHALLGAYNDPIFGIVNTNFYTQMRLDNPGPTSFGNAPIVDSVVLSLQYAGYYGQATAQTFEVYELNTSLQSSVDTLYYAFNTRSVESENLVVPGQGTIVPKPTTKAIVGLDTLAAQLRIPLKISLGQDLIAGVANYNDQESFQNFFKGIHVKVLNENPAPGSGGVFYFNLGGINSKLTIYYKDGAVSKSFAYLMNNQSVDFSHLDFNRNGKPIDQVINNPALGQKEFYAQAFTSRAVIEFPSLNDIPKNSIIHKAQLILPVVHYTNNLLYPSAQIAVGTKKNAGSDIIFSLLNQSVESPTILTSSYSVLYDDASKSYILELRPFIQDVVTQKIANRGLFLRPNFFNSTVERIIFSGINTNNKKKPKLVVTYTTY